MEISRWTLIKETDQSIHGHRQGLYRCACGTEKLISIHNVKNNKSRSCGCLRSEVSRARKKHGYASNGVVSPEYISCMGAKNRCQDPKNNRYKWYGARGIEYRFKSYKECLDCLGPKPFPKYSIDRIDSDGHYEPGNVKWSDTHTQRVNRSKLSAK